MGTIGWCVVVLAVVLAVWVSKGMSERAVRAAMELSDEELARRVDAAYLQDSMDCVYFDEYERRKALTRRLVMK